MSVSLHRTNKVHENKDELSHMIKDTKIELLKEIQQNRIEMGQLVQQNRIELEQLAQRVGTTRTKDIQWLFGIMIGSSVVGLSGYRGKSCFFFLHHKKY